MAGLIGGWFVDGSGDCSYCFIFHVDSGRGQLD